MITLNLCNLQTIRYLYLTTVTITKLVNNWVGQTKFVAKYLPLLDRLDEKWTANLTITLKNGEFTQRRCEVSSCHFYNSLSASQTVLELDILAPAPVRPSGWRKRDRKFRLSGCTSQTLAGHGQFVAFKVGRNLTKRKTKVFRISG